MKYTKYLHKIKLIILYKFLLLSPNLDHIPIYLELHKYNFTCLVAWSPATLISIKLHNTHCALFYHGDDQHYH